MIEKKLVELIASFDALAEEKRELDRAAKAHSDYCETAINSGRAETPAEIRTLNEHSGALALIPTRRNKHGKAAAQLDTRLRSEIIALDRAFHAALKSKILARYRLFIEAQAVHFGLAGALNKFPRHDVPEIRELYRLGFERASTDHTYEGVRDLAAFVVSKVERHTQAIALTEADQAALARHQTLVNAAKGLNTDSERNQPRVIELEAEIAGFNADRLAAARRSTGKPPVAYTRMVDELAELKQQPGYQPPQTIPATAITACTVDGRRVTKGSKENLFPWQYRACARFFQLAPELAAQHKSRGEAARELQLWTE